MNRQLGIADPAQRKAEPFRHARKPERLIIEPVMPDDNAEAPEQEKEKCSPEGNGQIIHTLRFRE
jgi:hypothetical protein